MKILVVSGSSVTRALFLSLLDASQYEVTSADSLPAALAIFKSGPPEVAIVQAEIVRTSPDALDRLRQAAAGGGFVAFVLVDRAYSDEQRGKNEARSFGAGAFVGLPPDRAALEEAVAAAAGRRRLSTSPSGHPVLEQVDVEPAIDLDQLARWAERLSAKLDSLDAYQILRVPPTASNLEIQGAFRQRALECHPDRQHTVPDEETRERLYQIFKRVSWAFRKVGDPVARREYDAARTTAG